ncbi:signal recognition particle-docking protein FtsY [Vagococcus intermedius]|uniref:Signal recognition particle receptor FtsY n=1 Tax=Vagococcus intermedius TaxID=2991418 RepID=A0AAF0CUA6_9ENTE|nr:signal recognition particle-docking protein FtsY [Vagococcus intermedius]WEG73150.1 signal recognition particle-docking protein FtsY [Vagococcus intermedius]WEG75234.1 signal recognition particle-docking protein FtsY [Vagococcus intermedius]
MGFFNKLKKVFTGEEEKEDIKNLPENVETSEEDITETVEKAEEVELEEDITETVEKAEEVELEEDITETVEKAEEVELEEDITETVEKAEEVELEEEVTETVEKAEEVELEEGITKAVEKAEEVELEEDITETVEKAEEVELEEDITETVEKAEEVELEEEVTETVEKTEEVELEEDSAEKMTKGLKKTRRSFSQVFNELMANFRRVDEDFFEELEETLITADVGFETAMKITDELRQEVKLQNAKKSSDVQRVIVEKLVASYEEQEEIENNELNIKKNDLTVILFVGVNGVGKTTSIGKLANQYRLEGKKVLMAAADTFRAGAIDQLVVWGERAQVEVVRGNAGGDPAAVVFDAIEKAKEQEADILFVDTAGRLQNKVNLMKELEKIKRVIQREIPDAPHEVLLVLDATTGQNAMVQAKQFKEVTDVTGLVLTKLDGTAKGGIVLAIRNELHIPVKLVGLGEGINDLQAFKPQEYVTGLFSNLLDDM